MLNEIKFELSEEEQTEVILKNIISNFEKLLLFKDNNFENLKFESLDDLEFFKKNYINTYSEDYEKFEENFIYNHLNLLKDEYYPCELRFSLKRNSSCKYIVLKGVVDTNEEELLYLNPFLRLLKIKEDSVMKDLEEEIVRLEGALKNLNELYNKYINKIKHPIMSSEAPVDMIKSTLNKSKKIKSLKNDLAQIEFAINDTNKNIANTKVEIEERIKANLKIDLLKEQVMDILMNNLEYKNY